MVRIKVLIAEARFERDVTLFLSMNPKYIINIKEEKIEGEVAFDGGKNPKWEQEHDVDIPDLELTDQIYVSFFHEDELIAQADYPLSDMTDEGDVDAVSLK